ncbi:CBS domain-containing protein CBSCBSPB1 [Artemisia annua]|uniref:CBS domain-containing protein CBSCBSPB1 n=1 Tax=Artemisia annua TaxID=35608 RepID=A0A2U1LUV0_ARTAN|nr:CBS domain-containing protein CBSCBSPB1 [Artemisia annua]
MTKNLFFVLADTLAVEALQTMVQGCTKHIMRKLLIMQHGQIIALLDIGKCLYDAIARMERAAEKGKAIAAAIEGVEKFQVPTHLCQNLRLHFKRMKIKVVDTQLWFHVHEI